jgi:TPR repeat protein
MNFDADNLLKRANAGDADAQYELAARLREDGYGFPVDLQESDRWLKLAAEGGNSTAQTQLAINLRGTKGPANERESIKWFRRAVDQGDSRARFNMGLNLLEGIGTLVNRVEAGTLIMMASLGGHREARELIAILANELSLEEWGSIVKQLKWPCLQFIMGPPVESDLKKQFDAYQDDPASAPRWLEMETEIANQTFRGNDKGSILDVAYGCKIKIVSVFCGQSLLGSMGLRTTATSIYANNIVTETGFPVYWPPDKAALDAIASTLCVINGREWIRHSYITF